MRSIFQMPYVTRTYPSPRTGEEVKVKVKEILVSDFPDRFAKAQFDCKR